MRRFLVDSPLGQIHGVEAGLVDAPPLILLHQTPRSVDEFAEVQPLLAERFRTIAFDTPGYGCSDPVAGEPSIADYAQAFAAALAHLGIERFFVLGHHTGAVIAVELAAAFPERVAGIALSGPVFLDAAMRTEIARHFKQWQIAPDGAHLLDKWQKLLSWCGDPELNQRLVVDLFRAGKASEQGHFAVANYEMERRWPLVSCPTLLVYGRHDPFADVAKSQRFRETNADCTAVVLDGGVFLPNQAPQALARAVFDWALSR